jgi:cell division control protein 6
MVFEIDKIFSSFDKNVIFQNKSLLQNHYQPKEIPYRDEQISQIASILAPVLRGERPSNLFLYGKTGTGKTLSIQFVRDELLKRAERDNTVKIRIEYLNCKLKKVSDTEYRILAELTNNLLKDRSDDEKKRLSVPDTGLPTQGVYNRFVELIDSEKQLLILILDEIDQTVKKISDDFLYNLTRLNSELSKAQICVVGISNDLTFLENLDPRVRSSLSEEEVVFPPYNALQIQGILKKRSEEVFKPTVLENGVLEKCAAFAAREHGDARRALDLLRIAGELAERDGSGKILLKHIDGANSKIERDKILDVVKTEPKQFQLVLYSIIKLSEKNRNPQKHLGDDKSGKQTIFTGEVYNVYNELCIKNKLEALTQRRVSDIIQEFDMLGIINVRVISKGRGGRTREIRLAITNNIVGKVKEIIEDSLNYNS